MDSIYFTDENGEPQQWGFPGADYPAGSTPLDQAAYVAAVAAQTAAADAAVDAAQADIDAAEAAAAAENESTAQDVYDEIVGTHPITALALAKVIYPNFTP